MTARASVGNERNRVKPPNPRLQRTGFRLPLSRQPLGIRDTAQTEAVGIQPSLMFYERAGATSLQRCGPWRRMMCRAAGPRSRSARVRSPPTSACGAERYLPPPTLLIWNPAQRGATLRGPEDRHITRHYPPRAANNQRLANFRCVTLGAATVRTSSRPCRSSPTPSNSRSPLPRSVGTRLISISSTRPAARYCCAAFAPPASDYVLAAGGPPRLFERRLDAVGDEREGRSAFERERLARVMREHEHRVMERRVGPPPAVPRLLGVPRAGVAAEHVAPHHGGADVGERLLDDPRAFVDLSAFEAVHRSPLRERKHPLVQAHRRRCRGDPPRSGWDRRRTRRATSRS